MAKLAFKLDRVARITEVREMPVYPIAEAAHYLCIPKATIGAWVRGTTYTTPTGTRRFTVN